MMLFTNMSKKINLEKELQQPFEQDEKIVSSERKTAKNVPQVYYDLMTLLQNFQNLDSRVDKLNFTEAEKSKHHQDFQRYIQNLNQEINIFTGNIANYRVSAGYVDNFYRKFNNLQEKFDTRQREINKSIFENQKIGSQENYINNLKKLYKTFDNLSNPINALPDKDALSQELIQENQQAKRTLDETKANLLKELNKYEKIDESALKSSSSGKLLDNITDDNVKNLQLYLDEAKFIISNLTEAVNYEEKIDHLNQIKNLFKEMTEPANGLELNKTGQDILKNIIPLTVVKKNSTKTNHDINHELDRMLSQILKEQDELLSLLVSHKVLKNGEEGILFNDPKNEVNNKITSNTESKKLTEVKQKYIKLYQQEYKLRAIKESPDQYIANKTNTEKLNKEIKTLRKEIITLRQNASAIQKESDELEKKKLATGFFDRVFNRIVYGSDKTINKKIEALEGKKEKIDNQVLSLTTKYKKQNEKRTKNSQIYSLMPDVDLAQLYNKVMEKREAAKNKPLKKESWVKRIFSANRSKGKVFQK